MAWGALTITLREGLRVNPLEEREQRLLLGECHLPTKKRTSPVCHNLLHDPKIFQLLYRVDEALAEEARTTRCACGGKWHRADCPRKPKSPVIRSSMAITFFPAGRITSCPVAWRPLRRESVLRHAPSPRTKARAVLFASHGETLGIKLIPRVRLRSPGNREKGVTDSYCL